jgi:hypothetical protein
MLSVLYPGCGRDDPATDSAQPATATEPDRYTVRGEVTALPAADDPTRGFYVRHEAIDDFKAPDGSVLGMDAMTMQFPLDDPALLNGVAVGDRVELIYEVSWQGAPTQRVTGVRKLPPDTKLEFRDARPPSDP